MEPEAGEEFDDDVAEGCGGKDKGEVGPGERGEVAGEEADEKSDAESDPGSEDCGEKFKRVGEVDGGQGLSCPGSEECSGEVLSGGKISLFFVLF